MMPAEMRVRAEIPADEAAIADVIARAFSVASHSSHTEQFIVAALRNSGALAISLVAVREAELVGHIAFSAVTVSDGARRWYGLGPIAVDPALHGRGIGSALVHAGLAQLRAASAAGCVVVGDPAYYGRFGFCRVEGLVYSGLPPEYFMALAFEGHSMPRGAVAYDAAFASESDSDGAAPQQ
jgi:putative acetyltransferase